MARNTRSVNAAGREYLISDDDSPHPEQLWWAVLRARMLDELSGRPPARGVRITSTTPRCVPRVGSDGIVGLAARPRDVSSALVTPGMLTAEVSAPGYLPRSLDAAIDAARRMLLGGAPLGATSLTVVPNEVPPREQFIPGRGVMIEREVTTDPEQFSLVADVPPPAPDVVPIVDPVRPGRTGLREAAGVPIVLPDQPLHLASVAVLRGRATRPGGLNGAPIAIGIDRIWWTHEEVRAYSNPPHLSQLVSFVAPLAFDHAEGTTVERCTLGAADVITHRLGACASAGARELRIGPWASLNAAGGDVLEIEQAGSNELELVVTDGFTAPPDPSAPAVVRLRTPLAFPHGASAPLFRRNVTPFGAGTVDREAQRGDRVLFMTTALAADGVLRLEPGTQRDELRFVRRVPTFAAGVAVASDGTFEFPPLARVAQVRIRAQYDTDPEIPVTDIALDYDGDNTVHIQFP
jgi:hypothetical protein